MTRSGTGWGRKYDDPRQNHENDEFKTHVLPAIATRSNLKPYAT